ncbi:MAG: hypothetical protein H6677_15845 [Candidatus Obscuribacterales bacterium]|nr:hypothetical protein [Cyanobacteria bacterium HKST-UBA01]MCB9469741.1 hypothetical protein [Candidatus Obscuribacterales bacterium]
MNVEDAIKKILPVALVMASSAALSPFAAQPVSAEVLQGNISRNEAMTRLARPSGLGGNISSLNTTSKMPPLAPPIQAQSSHLTAMGSKFDISTFKNSFDASASKSSPFNGLSGAAKSDDYASKNKFDLGADRNSRELTLAWERWHKQLSKAIYDSWSSQADEPGKSTLKVIVRRDRTIQVILVNTDASSRFNRQLRDVIMSLQGNPGLSFPTKSQRSQVSFEADYIAARNVTPGYSWVKDDYETVRDNY